jgi:rhodanese-related sulfurtransferase
MDMDRRLTIARAAQAAPGLAIAHAAGRGAMALRVAVLLGAGGGLGLLVNLAHPRGVRLSSFAAPTSCAQPPAHPGGHPGESSPGSGAGFAGGESLAPVEILSLAQVAGLCGDPRALVADARSAELFAQGHVSGAIHLSCASSRGAASAALDLLAGKDTLVVYGDGTDDALPVAEEMRRRGVRPGLRVAVLAGGFPAWSQAGMACSSGPCADCGAHR